jgi:hypothetical protein
MSIYNTKHLGHNKVINWMQQSPSWESGNRLASKDNSPALVELEDSLTEGRGEVLSRPSYSGVPGFKSRPGHRVA